MTGWRKSSRCGASNTCVEVAWRSACMNASDCVQVGASTGAVLVRDSADPDGPRLALSRDAFAGMVAAIKDSAHRTVHLEDRWS